MLPNFTTIIEDGERIYLFAENDYNRKALKVNDLQSAFSQIVDFLAGRDYPVNAQWVQAVAQGGSQGQGLKALVAESVKAEIARLKIPAFMRGKYEQIADEIPDDTLRRAGELYELVSTISNEIPFDPEKDLAVSDEGAKVDADAILSRARESCIFEVSGSIKADAEKILELAKAVRKMELNGLNALELVAKFAANEETPSPLSLYSSVVLRRHSPGAPFPMVVMTLAEYMALHP